jgi:hypothetical protein
MAYETMLAATAVLISLTPLGAKAQDSTHRSVKAISGQRVQLSVHFTLKRDCSASPPPELRVVTPPSNGTLSIRSGTVRAPQAGNCRNVEAQGRVVFYQSNMGYTGPDQVTVEVKKAEGPTESQSVLITVEKGPPAAPNRKKPDSTEL